MTSHHDPHLRRLDHAHYQNPNQVIFITIRAKGFSSPFMNSKLCQVAVDTLRSEQEPAKCLVFTYCLMPDHLHFLIRPNDQNGSVITYINRFKGITTNNSWRMGSKGQLWQERYYDHVIRTDENLEQISNYILLNPVRKGLAATIVDWPWSGEINAVGEIYYQSD